MGKIVNMKESEKFLASYNFYKQMLDQFVNFKKLRESDSWLVTEVKGFVRKYYLSLKEEEVAKLTKTISKDLNVILSTEEIAGMEIPNWKAPNDT